MHHFTNACLIAQRTVHKIDSRPKAQIRAIIVSHKIMIDKLIFAKSAVFYKKYDINFRHFSIRLILFKIPHFHRCAVIIGAQKQICARNVLYFDIV